MSQNNLGTFQWRVRFIKWKMHTAVRLTDLKFSFCEYIFFGAELKYGFCKDYSQSFLNETHGH